MRGARILCLSFAAAGPFAGLGCSTSPAIGPRIRILGAVQDGGLPHAACWCSHCRAARTNASRRRYVSSLALIIPRQEGHPLVYLFDATPDIREQLDLLHDLRPDTATGIDRRPIDGVFLTHAHIGHYLGLAFFGYEALNTSNLPVYCTPRMADYLRTNGPWSQLVRIKNICLTTLEPDNTTFLPDNLVEHVEVTSLKVPHRDEYSDTVGYLFHCENPSPGRIGPTVLFVPDTERWDRWNPSLPKVIERYGVTVAILDGSFYSADELPDRGATRIGHPLMKDTMDLLEPQVRAGRLTVYFTHLNHSNPAMEPTSRASREIEKRGFRVAKEGNEIPL